jgi:YD repeat-containing protein
MAMHQFAMVFALSGLILVLHPFNIDGQTYPSQQVNASYVPPSPNAQASQMNGDDPISLFEGSPSVTIPVYDIKCGSLSLPITLSYNYNGFLPLQDAGWVGLGWNLNVGGVISRIVEGEVDSSQASGYNYGQYNIVDSIGGENDNLNVFLTKPYDLAPDIFDAEFPGGSGKFFWYNGKAFLLDYDKQIGVTWPSVGGNITITTEDGTAYVFGAKETTTSNTYWFGTLTSSVTYTSAWHLTMVVSADKKDTINLNYGSYTWQQAQMPYQYTYTVSTQSNFDIGYDTVSYLLSPSIQAQVLQSITCRNARVSFIASGSPRSDVAGSYPSLGEIDIRDSITGNMVRKDLFSYEYLGQTSTNPQGYEHLKLKRFNAVDMQNASDTLTYGFSYVNEYGPNFPLKTTLGVDYWGYYNGSNSNTSLLPNTTCPYYEITPESNFSSNNMTPNFAYSSYGALDTIIYPTGGYSVFQYQQNSYYNSGNGQTLGAPGICLASTTSYDKYKPGFALQKKYTYLQDNGSTCSGILVNSPNYANSPYVTVTTSAGVNTTYNYTVYTGVTNSSGVGGISPKFYYSKVTESVSSAGETHKSDYYFTGFNTLFQDVRLTKKIDYSNQPNTNYYSKVSEIDKGYSTRTDTSFQTVASYIDQENIDHTKFPAVKYQYGFTASMWSTYWIYPTTEASIQYDIHGNTATTTTTYNFNPVTRNLSTVQQTTSDGQILTHKYKYPEDYTTSLTGNMIASRVLSPAIEKQTWMKRDANDSALISGELVQFDQTIFKPIATYGIETTAPIQSLSNETLSGGKYSSLLSTSQYVLKSQLQYDGSNYPSTVTKASDMNVSYIWDYKHSIAVAEVRNAAQADIAFSSFEADGMGNWTFTGSPTSYPTCPQPPTGNYSYNLGQTSGNISKSGLTSSTVYILSYWTTNSSALSITGTQSGYPVKGKTINGWTYYEHKITGVSSVLVSGSGYIDELRLYPASAQMTTFTYLPLIGKTTECDVDNRITYYQYDGFGRLRYLKDQDGNIVKTIEYHYLGK